MAVIGMSEIHPFNDRRELDAALASAVSERLQVAVASRGKAYLVVSGGSTPANLFTLLARTNIDWDRVVVLLADERWVADDDKDRNERLVRETLLTQNASDAEFVSLIPASGEGDNDIASVLATLSSLPEFDVVLLGMGEDAHTASLFPCAAELAAGMTTHEDALITRPLSAPYTRVSLSKNRLLHTRHGMLHIVGEKKKAVLERALQSGNEMQYPISAFVGQSGFDCWWAP
jgi:6-phosphogluconolactonase